MTYTLRPRNRIVTPLAHTQSLNTSITNPVRYNGAKYAVATAAFRHTSGVLHAAPMIIPAGVSFDEVGIDVFRTAEIDTSSIANPTVITTLAPHGLATSDSVEIAGHTGSTPDINGIHTVTVTGATTFTIPVDVTVDGTGGTIQILTGAARIGLYHNDEVHSGPGQLLAELTRFTNPSAGFNSTAIDVSVHETAMYWLVVLWEGLITVQFLNGCGLFTGPAGATMAQGGLNYAGWGYLASGQGTTLPDPILHTDLVGTPAGPNVVLRCNNVPSMTMPVKRARRPLRHQPKEGEDQMQHLQLAAESAPIVEVDVPQDRMFLYPLTLHEPLELVSLDVSVSFPDGAGTGDAYVFIYESRADNMPGRLLFADAIDVSSTSTTAVLTNMMLGPGFYWVGVHQKGATGPTLDGCRALGDNLFALSGGNYPSAGFYVDDTNATPSDPFDLSLAQTDAAITPLVYLSHKATGLTRLNNPRRFVPAWPHVYAPDFWVGPCAAAWTATPNKTLFTTNSWAMLWLVDKPTTYDQASIEFDFGGTTTIDIRFGIYEDQGYRPGRLMRYLTPTTGITTADRVNIAITGDLTLMPGIYWLAVSNADAIGDSYVSGTGYSQGMDIRGGTQTPYIHHSHSAPLPTTWPLAGDAERDGPGLWMRVKHHA